MPLWGTPQSGSNPISSLNWTDVRPGDAIALWDGTESLATGSKSIAIVRGYSPAAGDNGGTFTLTGCALGSTVDIQGSNGVSAPGRNPPITPTLANMDASFTNIPSSQISGNGFYTDIGRSAFYRAVLTNLVDGDVPVLIYQR